MTGTKLRELREARGMLQREYAEALGVHRQTIIRSESNGEISKTLRDKVIAFELEQTRLDADANRKEGEALHKKMVDLLQGTI